MSDYTVMTNGRLALSTDGIAQALQVRPATVRDWVRRGLLRPAGGSPGRPTYDLRQARRAQLAKKPRRHARP